LEKSAKIDYYPIDDVRAIKPKNEKTSDIRSAILETAKYPVKPMEWFCCKVSILSTKVPF